ncbi:MAG TPA: ferredoxin family protein [Rhizomicrobium sp.]|nr:ferredoxin family protein [Rhizomicrobium sp.]
MSAAVDCKQPAGVVRPEINRSRCEGKEDCVRVCPYDVFEIRTLTKDERRALPFFARLKAAAHGNRQAFAVRAEACHACGLCVQACPERAIRLVRASP